MCLCYCFDNMSLPFFGQSFVHARATRVPKIHKDKGAKIVIF